MPSLQFMNLNMRKIPTGGNIIRKNTVITVSKNCFKKITPHLILFILSNFLFFRNPYLTFSRQNNKVNAKRGDLYDKTDFQHRRDALCRLLSRG